MTVADTGIGMDPQDVEVALQPFAQVDNRLERRYEGTGLGLPLTKALVDLHKGSIAHRQRAWAAAPGSPSPSRAPHGRMAGSRLISGLRRSPFGHAPQ